MRISLGLLLVFLAGCGSVQHIHTVTKVRHVTLKEPPTIPQSKLLPDGVAQLDRYDFLVPRGAEKGITRNLCPDTKSHNGAVGVSDIKTMGNGDLYVMCYDPAHFDPPPSQTMTPAEFRAIQKGEPSSVLNKFYPFLAQDKDGSGETAILSTDGRTVYDIQWHCDGKDCATETVAGTRAYSKEGQ